MTSRPCETCGEGIPGRAKPQTRFCSNACRQKSYRARTAQRTVVPAEMRTLDRWVTWKPRRVRGRVTKVPLTVDGKAASSTNATTWTAWEPVSRLDRRGFVLAGDGLVCIDLDHCLTAGQLAPWAAELLEQLPPTYMEVSPSGDGIHVWGLGAVRAGRKIRDGRNIECYSTGRYITVTARRFGACPSMLADLSDVLAQLLA